MQGTVKLNGEWAFYWNQLVHASDKTEKISSNEYFISLPSSWDGYAYDGQQLKGLGFATYHLRILLPKDTHELALMLNTSSTAMALFQEDSLIYQAGQVGTTAVSSRPEYAPDFVRVQSKGKEEINLYLQVSNFHFRRGGAWTPLVLGKFTDVRRKWLLEVGLDFFLAGSIFIMALYHLGYYFLRKEDIAHLIFGLASFVIFIRIISTGQSIIRFLFPTDWVWMLRLELLSFYIFVPLFTYFLYLLFPKLIPRLLVMLSAIIGFLFSLFVLVSNSLYFSYTVVPYQLVTIIISLMMIYQLMRNYHHNIPGYRIFIFGLLIFFFTFINDLLYANDIISTGFIISIGLLIFILCQSLILSLRVSQAIYNLKRANEVLTIQNDTIQKQNTELIQLNKELDVFVYRTSHDLRAPLTSTLGLIEVLKMEENPERFRQYLDLQEQSLNKLDNFIQDILNYSRNTRLDVASEPVDFQALTEEVFSLYQHLDNYEIMDKRLSISQEQEFYSDKNRINIVLNNLVSNAFRYYNPREPFPFIEVKIVTYENEAQITVKDNGLGIDEKHHKKIFDMFYRASNHAKGTGLGLFIVQESVQKLKGELKLKSQPGEGSTFIIHLPNNKRNGSLNNIH